MNLNIQIYADGAHKEDIRQLNKNDRVHGFTTNPTLMRKAGVQCYKSFASEVLDFVSKKPISFEVFSDDLKDMLCQAREIASWGDNVFVKIPITNTKGICTNSIIQLLAQENIKVNVTAVFTIAQIQKIIPAIDQDTPMIISIFAGRIADTGRDPIPLIQEALQLLRGFPNIRILWASPREVLNIVQADEVGCDIITVSNDLLKKLPLLGKNLNDFSLETVKMFYNDALKSNYCIPTDIPT